MQDDNQPYTVIYRPIEKKDYKGLGDIIVDTWRFHEISPNARTVAHFGCSYLLTSLLNQTYHQVALVDGKPAGIIISADKRKKKLNFKYLLQLMPYGISLLWDRNLKERNRHWKGYHEKTEALLSKTGVHFDAELTLFIVDEKYRGLGIGGQLYQNLMDYYEREQVESFYLQTDTGCSYEFYESHGLDRLAQCKTGYSYAGVRDITMYLYGRVKEKH